MMNGMSWKLNEVKVFIKWALSSLLDGGFLALWVFVQWLVNNQVIANLPLTGVDWLVLLVFQILFAVSTLMPVVIYICVDISKMFLRARRAIQREILLSKSNESDNA